MWTAITAFLSKFSWLLELIPTLWLMARQIWYLKVRDYDKMPEQGGKPRKEIIEELENDLTLAELSFSVDEDKGFCWLLDAASGNNVNESSPLFEDGESRFYEWQFTRNIVGRIASMLDDLSIRYEFVVRENEDVSDSSRIERANTTKRSLLINQPILLSVSVNKTGDGESWRRPSGVETVHYFNELHSRRFAAVFQEYLVEGTSWRDRGIRTENIKLLKSVNMPAVLARVGFYTHKNQVQDLLNEEIQNDIATAFVQAISDIERLGTYEGY